MKKLVYTVILSLFVINGFSQDIMTVLPDSSGKELFSDFIGVKLWGGQFGLKTVNQDLTFKLYSPSNNQTIQHSMNLQNLNRTTNGGLGLEENVGSHLLINFMDLSFGLGRNNVWNWNIGAGAGYFVALDKKNNLRLRASVNLFYESISYELGSYTDTTNLGFYVNGNSLGTYLKGIKYVDNSLCSNIEASLMYRTSELDIYAGMGWTYTLIDSESLDFNYTRLKVNEAIYNSAGTAMYPKILSQGNFMFQIGIVREFGL